MGKRVKAVTQDQITALSNRIDRIMTKLGLPITATGAAVLEENKQSIFETMQQMFTEKAILDAMRPPASYRDFCNPLPPMPPPVFVRYQSAQAPIEDRIAVDRAERVTKSVKNALRLMYKVSYHQPSKTTLNITSMYSRVVFFSVRFEAEVIRFVFCKRSGERVTETFNRNSDAAAAIAATVMFYCMKTY